MRHRNTTVFLSTFQHIVSFIYDPIAIYEAQSPKLLHNMKTSLQRHRVLWLSCATWNILTDNINTTWKIVGWEEV